MKKRLLALLLSAGLIVSAIPSVGLAAEKRDTGTTDERTLVASYDMSHADGKLTDSSGFGNDANIVGFTEEDFGTESEDTVLNFKGDKSKFIELPAGLVQEESFAVEAKFKPTTVANSWLWCFGTKVNEWPNVNNYVFVSPAFEGNVIRAGMKDNIDEKLFGNEGSLVANEYSTVRMEFDNGELILLVNGEERTRMSTGFSVQEILKNGTAGDICGYIGRSLYAPDSALTGTLTQFNVYATVEEVFDPEERHLVASYNMNSADGKLTDESGLGNDAPIVGFTKADFAVEGDDTVLNFPADKSKYIKLPAGLIQAESFSVEATFKTATKSDHWLWCLGSKEGEWPDVKNYVFLNPMQKEQDGGNIRAGIKDSDNERMFANTSALAADEYTKVTLDFNKGVMKLYVNDVENSTLETSYSIQDILEKGTEGDVCGYIGRSLYKPDAAFRGTLTQFNVYSTFKDTRDEVMLTEDMDAISVPESTSEDLVLPVEGSINGSTILWESSNPDVLSADGKVTLPADNTTVTLTANGTYGGYQASKNYDVLVVGKSGLLKDAYDALDLADKDNVRGNLPLVKTGLHNTTIEWKSDNAAVITDSSDADGLYDGGIVTRPAAGKEAVKVKLTATIKLPGGETKDKVFDVTVQPMKADLDTDYTAGYLWTNFAVDGGYEKVFYGYSEDGLTWGKLNKDENGTPRPVLQSNAEGSELAVRDPHLIRSPEGDRYWILGTDQHAEGNGPGGNGYDQTNGSQSLVVFESDDLVNWSEARLVYSGFENAGCIWAPEAIYDEATGDYLVYWSSRDKSKAGTNDNALRVYVSRTRDFTSFSEPQVWLSEDEPTSEEVNIIDTSIVKDKDKFYRFSTSDWRTIVDVSDTLATDDVFDVQVNRDESVKGSWSRLIKRNESYDRGFQSGEGLTVYQLPDGTWCAMADSNGYTAYLTDDLAKGTFTKSSDAKFIDGGFRHGTVVRLSQAEQDRILKAYGEKEVPDPERKVLADFNFDADGSGFTSENAKATGTYKLEDSLDGKAIYLNGTSDYLNVTAQDGKSLLTGANELTVSYEAKSDRNSTNWIMYAAPNANKPVHLYESYIGIMENGTTTWTERYRNSGERPYNPAANTGSDWVHVDVVLSKTDTKIYVNGIERSKVDSYYSLPSILGKSSILQIGKANWENGEYFKGWIDNFRIENRALSAEEVKVNAKDVLDKISFKLNKVVTGTAPDRDTALTYRGTDDHTAITTKIDNEKKEITAYVRKNADLKKIPVSFDYSKEVDEITINGKKFINGSEADLSKEAAVVFKTGAKTETYTMKVPVISNNPALPGQYADSDIDYMDGKFWIFPTTDGYPGWSGTVFHAFSSTDMVDWKDEGIILDLANDNPGKNENGVQIASSPWAVGSAWAPSIEEKDGKYYFYYCGKFKDGPSAIGVAVADDPAGPYVDKGEALLTVDMCQNAGVPMGQAIDPSIFTDDDGTSYIAFGNGNAAIAELNDDMMSIKEGTLKPVNGLEDFRESVVITKRDGKYHWTWSCDDTNSPNYHVNYGVSDTLSDANGSYNVKVVKKNLLSKDESKGILGTAHQSVVSITDGTGKDRYFMAYHRFYTPLDIFTDGDGRGSHRESCIDEIFFDENGYMTISPTLEGVSAVVMDPTEPADKTALQKAVDRAKAVDTEKYTEATVKAMNDALKKAEDILKDDSLKAKDQAKVDAAAKALNDAVDGLDLIKAKIDKTALKEAIDKAKAVKTDKYTEATVKAMNDALKTAEDLMKDDSLTGDDQEKVDAAAKALNDAINKLETKKVEDVFKDISADSWYRDYVQYVFDRDIMTGLKKDEFGTDVILTRSHFATMLYRIEGEPEVTYIDRFKDVPDEEFYTNPVMWASDEEVGVINGYLDGNFGPNDPITREQMAVMLYRYAEYKGYDMKAKDDLTRFEDASKVSEFAKDAMQWAVGAELIKGEGEGNELNPQGATSRAVCATIMQRFIEKYDK